MCCGGGGDFPTADEIGQAGATYNRIDQETPYGSLTYSGPHRNKATMTLSPAALELQESMMGLQRGALSTFMDRYGASPMEMTNPQAPETFEQSGAWDPVAWTQENRDSFGGDREALWAAREEARLAAKEAWIDSGGGSAWQGDAGVGNGTRGGGTRTDYEDPRMRGGGDRMSPRKRLPWEKINLDYDLGLDELGSMDEARGRYEEAHMERARGLLDPYYNEQQGVLDERLANRGLPTGTEETEILQGRFGRERSDAYTKAALDAILYGGSEVRADRGQTLNERVTQLGAQSGVRSQLFNEDTTEYNRLASLLGMTQTPGAAGGIGGFFGPGQVDMTGAYGLQNQGTMANQGFMGDLIGGMLGLGGQVGGGWLAGR